MKIINFQLSQAYILNIIASRWLKRTDYIIIKLDYENSNNSLDIKLKIEIIS